MRRDGGRRRRPGAKERRDVDALAGGERLQAVFARAELSTRLAALSTTVALTHSMIVARGFK